jgi:hypothetical protein
MHERKRIAAVRPRAGGFVKYRAGTAARKLTKVFASFFKKKRLSALFVLTSGSL